MASQQAYSIPSDYSRVRSVFLKSTTTQIKLTPIRMEQRDPAESTGTPLYYYVWGLNVSGNNSPTIELQPIPSTSGSSDLIVFAHQIPADMVSGGQAPEVMYQWQDALSTYGAWRCYQRRGLKYEGLARDTQAEWEDWINQARRFHNPMGLDQPTSILDTGGYLQENP